MDNFNWTGEEVSCYNENLQDKHYKFYRSFQYDNYTFKVNDMALVKSSSTKLKVCQLLCLFESSAKWHKTEHLRAVVRWFTFTKDLPKLYLEGHQFDEENEVVEDLRKANDILNLRNIMWKASLVFAIVTDPVHLISEMQLDKRVYYSCRYKIKKNQLIPIFDTSLESDCTPDIKIMEEKLCNRNLVLSPSNKFNANACVTPNKAKRNLNDSFNLNTTTSESPILNYSIVEESEIEPLKIKLKLSKSQLKPMVYLDKLSDNLVYELINKENTEVSTPNVRKSTRVSIRKSYTDYISPRKTPRRDRLKGGDDDDLSRTAIKSSDTPNLESLSYTPKRRTRNKSTDTINLITPEKKQKLDDTVLSRSRRKSTKTVTYSEIDDEVELLTILDSPLPKFETPVKKTSRRNSEVVIEKKLSFETPLKTVSEQTPKKKTDIEIKTPTRQTKRVKILDSIIEEMKKSRKTPVSKTTKVPKTPTNSSASFRKKLMEGSITPSMQIRNVPISNAATPLNMARTKLHVSYVPNALPCREKEFEDILGFVEGKLLDGCGGCIYISGVPGTGKTATVTEVIKSLQVKVDDCEIPDFDFVSINGMKLSEPRQSYVEILKQLDGQIVVWEQAQKMLDNRFTKKQGKRKQKPVVLLVDELDILCTKRQDVVYNLLDWPTKATAQLIVLTIANTMDLPERLLMGRVTSRLGLTRLTFQAYTHKQLQEIVTKRLTGTNAFNPDAIQLAARKVASVSGDARRALDICRRAAEIAEADNNAELVSMGHVNEALNSMITQPKVQAIKLCSRLEQLILQSIVAEVERTGVDETTFADVYTMFLSVAGIDGFRKVSITLALAAVARLGACRLLLTEQKSVDLNQKLILNVSSDDIYYALRKD